MRSDIIRRRLTTTNIIAKSKTEREELQNELPSIHNITENINTKSEALSIKSGNYKSHRRGKRAEISFQIPNSKKQKTSKKVAEKRFSIKAKLSLNRSYNIKNSPIATNESEELDLPILNEENILEEII